MSVEALSRIQFATVAIFHFLFVPLTLGLSGLVAFMETRYAITGDETYLRMTKYWSKLFIVNFAVGVVTGLTLEFQFGMNWAEYSKFVGDIFGAPLAIEATVAFFLESTFLGLWMFSWKRVSKGVHAAIIWVVAIASTLSALWILLANGWMQKPRGLRPRRRTRPARRFRRAPVEPVRLDQALPREHGRLHARLLLRHGHLRGPAPPRKSAVAMFKRSFRIGATVGLAASLLIIVAGDLSGRQVAEYQPTKLAAMESQWTTVTAAPFYLLELPDPNPKAERNLVEAVPVPNMLSLLSYHDPEADGERTPRFPGREPPLRSRELLELQDHGSPRLPLRPPRLPGAPILLA